MAGILILSNDLLDSSRVVGYSRAVGVETITCRDQETLLKHLEKQPVLVVLDLQNNHLDLSTLLPACKSLVPSPRIIGYGPHVDAERLKAAKEAGCSEVLPRSAFFKNIESNLKKWL
jgi:DNA-binding NtrC family response regulator